MGDYSNRQSLLKANRYQRPIIGLTLLPTFVFCALLTVFVLYLHLQLVQYLSTISTMHEVNIVNRWGLFILVTIWTFFGVMYVWAKLVSGKQVGAFERIIRELDQVIEGEDVGMIKARENDYLPNDLLRRVNVLIKKCTDLESINTTPTIG